jgi:protein TonB
MTARGNTAQVAPPKPLAKPAPNTASKPQPTPSATAKTAAPEPRSADTVQESLKAPAAKSPDSQPAPEALTQPSFGAAYLRNPAPGYPGVAQQRGWQGTVLLKVHVLASGRPDHVGLASSSGHDSLDDAAIEAVTHWRFAPARRGDQAIDGWVQVPIEFKLGT